MIVFRLNMHGLIEKIDRCLDESVESQLNESNTSIHMYLLQAEEAFLKDTLKELKKGGRWITSARVKTSSVVFLSIKGNDSADLEVEFLVNVDPGDHGVGSKVTIKKKSPYGKSDLSFRGSARKMTPKLVAERINNSVG